MKNEFGRIIHKRVSETSHVTKKLNGELTLGLYESGNLVIYIHDIKRAENGEIKNTTLAGLCLSEHEVLKFFNTVDQIREAYLQATVDGEIRTTYRTDGSIKAT
jgi:hypothetical protein